MATPRGRWMRVGPPEFAYSTTEFTGLDAHDGKPEGSGMAQMGCDEKVRSWQAVFTDHCCCVVNKDVVLDCLVVNEADGAAAALEGGGLSLGERSGADRRVQCGQLGVAVALVAQTQQREQIVLVGIKRRYDRGHLPRGSDPDVSGNCKPAVLGVLDTPRKQQVLVGARHGRLIRPAECTAQGPRVIVQAKRFRHANHGLEHGRGLANQIGIWRGTTRHRLLECWLRVAIEDGEIAGLEKWNNCPRAIRIDRDIKRALAEDVTEPELIDHKSAAAGIGSLSEHHVARELPLRR